ncbi:MAG: DNA recombination protein RmuC [Acholeplasmataceae bacterium]|nr:DNA recombination protein RmuC [Acholeplasmataceae bacterium]
MGGLSMKELEIIIIVLSSLNFLILLGVLFLLFRKNNGGFEEKLDSNRAEIVGSLHSSLELLGSLLKNSNEQLSNQQNAKLDLLIKTLTANLEQLNSSFGKSALETEQKLENIRQSVEKSLTNLRQENQEKLDEIRQTVDEKLQKTLEDRLTKSFQLVSDRLEQVYKGLGEMQNLASGVGDLKKVLTNVKTQGTLGEIQLANILEEIMTPDQYETQIATKQGSKERVDFAIKLPGTGDDIVYLPIDAKFPLNDYQNLLDAYESGSPDAVKSAQANLMRTLKAFAKSIQEKYIDVPNTTEFGIMFLPVEGLYAEAVKSGVLETLQREYRINLAGPTTMAAFLNSLQMGFRTLAIQKRSGEVWKILGAVKTEFEKFGKVLETAQSKISEANKQLDLLVGTRTRQIRRKLKSVTELPETETQIYLPPTEE